jgi:peptide/nickel transport system substrate-binding protein
MSALLAAWSGRPDPDLNAYRYLHSEAATSPSGIQDDVLDDLIIRARETPDVEERRELYQQLIDRIAEIVPILYLEGLPKSMIVRDDVGGVVMPPDGNVRPQYLFIES